MALNVPNYSNEWLDHNQIDSGDIQGQGIYDYLD
jgi:hypothetical protein